MFAIVANVREDNILRRNALVYILRCNGDAERPYVRGLSKSGRKVSKYIPYKRLVSFRPKWVHDKFRSRISFLYKNREEAQIAADRLNEMWKNIRFFDKGGNLLQDGQPASQAFTIRMESKI